MSQQAPDWWHGDVSRNNIIIPTNNPDEFQFETPGERPSQFSLFKNTGNSSAIYIAISLATKEMGDSWSRIEFLHTFVIRDSEAHNEPEFNVGLARSVNANLVAEGKCAVSGDFLTTPGPKRFSEWKHYEAAHVYLESNLREKLLEWLGFTKM